MLLLYFLLELDQESAPNGARFPLLLPGLLKTLL